MLAPVLPRLALVAFTFCQPLLINRFLSFLQNPEESMNIGFGLIGAFGVVYFGIAISSGFYWHRIFRFVTTVRGTYVSAIYRKTTQISITDLDNVAAVTLMSTDVERIMLGLQRIHEIWANLVQVALSTWLLQRELGVACFPPLVIAIGEYSLLDDEESNTDCRPVLRKWSCSVVPCFFSWATPIEVGGSNSETSW
jgi:ATP-binding cassette subfamily C (CFTR/MRP) protein 1